ncbi:MAG: DUF6714 family protein [Verrucomicrobiota bacterium]|nr:DUF6714 family protein [Verrucomicrobiota bacterium]
MEIQEAFDLVVTPAASEWLHEECGDDDDIVDFFRFKSWKNIPSATIAKNYSALPFLSPKAFAFVLPAYLIWVLENYKTSASPTVDTTIYNLTPFNKSENLDLFIESKYHLLTNNQKTAILKWLLFLSKYGEERVDMKFVRKALGYWLTYQ